jgi:tetratricopeptide repeat protein 8
MLGFAYLRLNVPRDAEAQLRSSLRDQPMVLTYHLLAKVYIRLDQPKNAADAYTQGLEHFPQDTSLMAGVCLCGGVSSLAFV